MKHPHKLAIIHELLKAIGEPDLDREGIRGTPARVVRMWDEMFAGYDENNKPKVTTFRNGIDGVVCNQMVCDTGSFHSTCEHHMLPFVGRYWFAYIPHEKGLVLGLSKVARVVDWCGAKLQIQERLGSDILKVLTESLHIPDHEPLGFALCLEAEHLCKTMRGVKKAGKMRTTSVSGCFVSGAARAEFLSYVNSNKG